MTEPCPGPVPPQTPRLTAPSGACDTHAHILGPYDRFPLNENRSYTAPESTFEDYMHLLDRLGLERAVIVHGSAHGMMLAATEDAVMRLGDNGRGVAVVEPDISDRELDRLHEIGFRGLRFTTLLRGGAGIENVPHMADRIQRGLRLACIGTATLRHVGPAAPALPAKFGDARAHQIDRAESVGQVIRYRDREGCLAIIGGTDRCHARAEA